MKKSVLNLFFSGVLAMFAFVLLQSFSSVSAEVPAVKCRKSTTSGDYCYTSGKTVTGCANSTETDDCANDITEE